MSTLDLYSTAVSAETGKGFVEEYNFVSSGHARSPANYTTFRRKWIAEFSIFQGMRTGIALSPSGAPIMENILILKSSSSQLVHRGSV
ncbi:hypothetical protein TNCV_1520661 [Trichonephila clavipes]|nr:hypothetical protein TNCV_1520661 [Trichonephila clavipes]